MLSDEERTRVRALPNDRRFGCRRKGFLTELLDSWPTSRTRNKRSTSQIEVLEDPEEEQKDDAMSLASTIS